MQRRAFSLSLMSFGAASALPAFAQRVAPKEGVDYLKLAKPLPFKVGDADACVRLGLQTIEAGPTVLAGGIEKDLSVVVAPSVTLPCTNEQGSAVGAQSTTSTSTAPERTRITPSCSSRRSRCMRRASSALASAAAMSLKEQSRTLVETVASFR